MSTAPTFTAAGEALYERMDPWAAYDPEKGYALAWLCAAIGDTLSDVYDFAQTGWDGVMNPDAAPEWFLPHLAMWAGVNLVPGNLTVDQKRARIRSTDGLRRGTTGAIVGAAAQHLTGLQRVVIYERTDPDNAGDQPYHLTIITYTSETPDAALSEAAIREQKPVGLILHYLVLDENSWAAAAGTWATVAGGVTWTNYTP